MKRLYKISFYKSKAIAENQKRMLSGDFHTPVISLKSFPRLITALQLEKSILREAVKGLCIHAAVLSSYLVNVSLWVALQNLHVVLMCTISAANP